MLRIYLHPKAERRSLAGHPWIFSNEIARVDGPVEPGIAAEVFSAAGQLLGTGYYNPHSLIAARLLSRQRTDIDQTDFFVERIGTALAYRRSLYPDTVAQRIVFGESDQLPGLVVDRYGEVLSIQLLSQGMERRRDLILDALQQLFTPRGIVARNDAAVRELEGLPRNSALLRGSLPAELVIEENGLQFEVDVMGGQKTGAFLDQKENHLALRGRVTDRKVLDLCCYSGSWSLHAAAYGATQVTGIDISAGAVELAQRNAQRNGVAERCQFLCGDAFEKLKDLTQRGERFGAIVLDPPAFIKSRKKLPEGVRGYLTVNRRAMELLEPGGYLFTCSCSHHMERELFLDTLRKAAVQSRRTLRLVEVRGQAYDHPVLLGCPETDYLKCVILQAV